MTSRRRRVARAIAAIVPVALGLGGAEIALRIANPPVRAAPWFDERIVQRDDLLGWTNRPHVAGTFVMRTPIEHAPIVSYTLTTNSRGMRGAREYDDRKPRGARRVAIAGDSFTFGLGVQDDEVFSAQLARDRLDLEVFNLGVNNYGVNQMLLRVERDAMPLRLDLAVIAVIRDDFRRAGEEYTVPNGYPRPMFRLEGERLVRPWRLAPPILPGAEIPRESPLLERAESALRRARSGLAGVPKESLEDGWRVGSAILVEARRVARDCGIPLLVVLLPCTDDLAVDQPVAVLLRSLAARHELGFVDLVPSFRDAARSGDGLFIPGDGHPSPRGHSLIAAALRREVDRILPAR
jgi:hypothetical protein